MLHVLDAAAIRQWCEAGHAALSAAQTEIDDLNVFPVPDGDTGTNLLLTVEAVLVAVHAAPDDLSSVAGAMARGALLGARGNSGVILSQLLRGLAEVLEQGPAGPAALGRGLVRAADLAYAAVAQPVEGTLLTVARAAGVAARGSDLAAVVRGARKGAEEALARTPQQLPALRDAGVVDAGGRGWVVLLEALEGVVTGAPAVAMPGLHVPRDRSGLAAAREAGSDHYGYEVQYLLHDADDDAVAQLRLELGALGDSLLVVGDDRLSNVHVHVNDVGAAVEAGVRAGRPSRITVTRFADQMTTDAAAPRLHRAVVAVATGEGLVRLFRQAGATVVPEGPSTAELLAAVRATGAVEVALLPNDPNVQAVARAAAAEAATGGVHVEVVPTRAVVQGLAALAVADPAQEFATDIHTMREAAAATRTGEVVRAARQAITSAGGCSPHDALGLLDGRVVLVGAELEGVARGLLDRLTVGAELVTLILGTDLTAGVGDRLRAYVAGGHPGVEVVVVDGRQRHPPLLIGAE